LGATYIVLVEGFHEEPRAKIDVLSERTRETLCEMDRDLIAIVTPSARQTAVPSVEPNSIKPLVDLIDREVLGKPGYPGVAQNSNFEILSVSQLPVR
jgi:hypothetical protein